MAKFRQSEHDLFNSISIQTGTIFSKTQKIATLQQEFEQLKKQIGLTKQHSLGKLNYKAPFINSLEQLQHAPLFKVSSSKHQYHKIHKIVKNIQQNCVLQDLQSKQNLIKKQDRPVNAIRQKLRQQRQQYQEISTGMMTWLKNLLFGELQATLDYVYNQNFAIIQRKTNTISKKIASVSQKVLMIMRKYTNKRILNKSDHKQKQMESLVYQKINRLKQDELQECHAKLAYTQNTISQLNREISQTKQQYKTFIQHTENQAEQLQNRIRLLEDANKKLSLDHQIALKQLNKCQIDVEDTRRLLNANCVSTEAITSQNERLRKLECELQKKIDQLEYQLFDTMLNESSNSKIIIVQARVIELQQINQRLAAALKEQQNTNLELAATNARLITEQDQFKKQANSRIRGLQPDKNESANNFFKRRSLQSQSSLKFSANSQSEEIEFHFQPESSLEEWFKTEKTKKRKDYVLLLEKTAHYIKNLKAVIEIKNKDIGILEKKVDTLTSNQGRLLIDNLQEQSTDLHQYEDNYSVKLENKRRPNFRRMKQVEDEMNLVMQENTLLAEQVERLQDQLVDAETQQQNLINLKQIYKEEINKLQRELSDNKSNLAQAQSRMKNLEQQQTNYEASVRQLFIKVTHIFLIDGGEDQRRKQLEEYLKVLSNLLRVQASVKQKLFSKR